MKIRITPEELSARKIVPSSYSKDDYITDATRRIFATKEKFELRDTIFEETVVICLRDFNAFIHIQNCKFLNGLVTKMDARDVEYSIFIYKCDIKNLNLSSDSKKKIEIDTSDISSVTLSGRFEKIGFFSSKIESLYLEYAKCDLLSIGKTEIKNYSFYEVNVNEVEFDSEDIAINDYSRLVPKNGQTVKQVSEIYHKLALKSAKSIKAVREINYQLTKATSHWGAFFFGYFYKPVYIILWMVGVIFLYSMIYWPILDIEYPKALYFSVYTFLTIGFGDVTNDITIVKTLLVFSEGLLGILYTATLLTSIVNSFKK